MNLYRVMRRAIWERHWHVGPWRFVAMSPNQCAGDAIIGADIRRHSKGRWTARVITPVAVGIVGYARRLS